MRLADGHRWREERIYDRMAWMTAYLLTPWSSDPITPAMLLGHSDPANDVAAIDQMIGAPADGEATYNEIMAKQAARKAVP